MRRIWLPASTAIVISKNSTDSLAASASAAGFRVHLPVADETACHHYINCVLIHLLALELLDIVKHTAKTFAENYNCLAIEVFIQYTIRDIHRQAEKLRYNTITEIY